MIRLSVRDREVVQTLRVDADKVFVGRSPSNTIVLKEPSASRKHCMLRVRDGAVEILDLNSKHGLQINGRAETRALLSVGDRIGIGTAEIRLEEIETEVAALGAFGGYLDDQEAVERPLELKETSTPETTPEKAEAEAASGGEETTPATPPPADASGKSFADELYRTLRRAPAWAVSLALHTLVIALLFRVPWPNERNDELYQSIRGGLTEGGTPLEESVPDDLAGQDIPLPEFEEDLPPRPEIEDALPSSAAEESATLPEPPALPIIAPAPDSARIHVKGLGSKSKVALGPNKSFGTGESGAVNREASGIVLSSLGGTRGRLAMLLRRRPASETVVVQGTYDRVETVLDLFRVPNTCVQLRELREMDLDGVRSIFVNCSNEDFPRDIARKVAKFVEDGGYLFSTDWALVNLVQKAFPKTICAVRRRGIPEGTPDMVVGVTARLRRHDLLEGTGLEKTDAQWWLEDSSYPVKILDPERVEVLVSSAELRKRYGTGAVAVTFTWGQGRVVHVMGHYFQKKGNLRGTFAMQKIITNFLIAAIRKR